MFEKLINVAFFVTAFIGVVGLATIVVLSEMTGPTWLAIMAAVGIVTIACFALLLVAALLFAGFIALDKWVIDRNNKRYLQKTLNNNPL